MEEQQPIQKKIFLKIPQIMADLEPIAKDRTNQHQGYAFRGIEDMYNAVHPVMTKHQVFCAPQVMSSTSDTFTSKNGTTSYRVQVRVNHKFYADDGSFIEVIMDGEGIDTSDKATNKAISSAMKYAFIELYSIPTVDVEDGDRTTPPGPESSPPGGKSNASGGGKKPPASSTGAAKGPPIAKPNPTPPPPAGDYANHRAGPPPAKPLDASIDQAREGVRLEIQSEKARLKWTNPALVKFVSEQLGKKTEDLTTPEMEMLRDVMKRMQPATAAPRP